MSYFIQSEETIRVSATDPRRIVTTALPPATYLLDSDIHGFFLSPIESFQHKGKLYGDTQANTDRIITTFIDRPNTTGVLLLGEKGSGKTLLARRISEVVAQQLQLPTIVVNAAYNGADFNNLMQMLGPCVVVFDEFEKVYKEKSAQEGILTLLDGLFPSKKLFILTVNDEYSVNSLMMNRPGRIYYKLAFHGLSSSFIEEYLKDNLKNQVHIPKVVTLAEVFAPFNFDMLKAFVEELNRYDEDPLEVLKFLNVSASSQSKMNFDVEATHEVDKVALYDGRRGLSTIPLVQNFTLEYKFIKPQRSHKEDYDADENELPHPHPEYWNSDYWEWKTLRLHPGDLVRYNVHTGVYEYQPVNGITIKLTKGVSPDVMINGVPAAAFKNMMAM